MQSSKLLDIDKLKRMNIEKLFAIYKKRGKLSFVDDEQTMTKTYLMTKILSQQRIKKLGTFIDHDDTDKLELLVFGFINNTIIININAVPLAIKQLICNFVALIASNTLIIYNGSKYMKVGRCFTANDNPLSIFPTIIGAKNNDVGDLALIERGSRYRHPIIDGVISDFDDMNLIWSHILNENQMQLQTAQECNVLLTEKVFVSKLNREKKTTLMFEMLDINGLYLECDAVLSLYACGRRNGCVLHSGAAVSCMVPVYEGYCLKDAAQYIKIGGNQVSNELMRMFIKDGFSFTTYAERMMIERVKEQFCYVPLCFDDEMKRYKEKYSLPDGNYLMNAEFTYLGLNICGYKMIEPLQIMFDAGIHKLCCESIANCDDSLSQIMYKNILLTGGNMMHKGMSQRVEKEIKILAPNTEINVIDVKNKNVLASRGGSIFASTSMFYELMITKKEYYEFGASIVHRKCF